jgi:hypothetical protein
MEEITSTVMTPERLAEIEDIEQGSSRGPWFPAEYAADRVIEGPDGQIAGTLGYEVGGIERVEDVTFICMARTAVPELAAEVKRLNEENDQLREQRDAARMAVDRVERLASGALDTGKELNPVAVIDIILDVSQRCPGCWRLHGLWCHPYGGPMADPDPAAYRAALDQAGQPPRPGLAGA